jgi:hypothetical protein
MRVCMILEDQRDKNEKDTNVDRGSYYVSSTNYVSRTPFDNAFTLPQEIKEYVKRAHSSPTVAG